MTIRPLTLWRSRNPPYEPDAACDACGTVGTVGRVVRTDTDGAALDVRRFCLACWIRESRELMARWEAEREREHRHVGHSGVLGGGIHARSATWDNAVFLVTGIEAALQRDASAAAIPPDTLAQLAAEIEHQAPELMGPMPDAVASFLKRYRANAS